MSYEAHLRLLDLVTVLGFQVYKEGENTSGWYGDRDKCRWYIAIVRMADGAIRHDDHRRLQSLIYEFNHGAYDRVHCGTSLYHRPTCDVRWVAGPLVLNSWEDAVSRRFRPCAKCQPYYEQRGDPASETHAAEILPAEVIEPDDARIAALEARLEELAAYVRPAYDCRESDPHTSLTKARTTLERLLRALYRRNVGVAPPHRTLFDMLSDTAFASGIPRRMFDRMQSIRAASNLGAHGGDVDVTDANRVLRDLIEVLEWYADLAE
jgi:hypothetical protein